MQTQLSARAGVQGLSANTVCQGMQAWEKHDGEREGDVKSGGASEAVRDQVKHDNDFFFAVVIHCCISYSHSSSRSQ